MNDSWATLILLGLAAGFMPMVFGIEIYALGTDDGAKKVSSLLGGITTFRLLVTIGVMLLVAGVLTALSQELADIGQFLSAVIVQLGSDVTSGYHIVVDLLLIAAGVMLFIQAIRQVRGDSGSQSDSDSQTNSAQATQSSDSKVATVGVVGMLGMGMVLAATNVNQWLFMSTGVNQILRMHDEPLSRLLAFFIFLLMSSVMIALPLGIYLIRPQEAQTDLAKVNGWINGSMRYVVAAILCLIGFYFIWQGGEGVTAFLATR